MSWRGAARGLRRRQPSQGGGYRDDRRGRLLRLDELVGGQLMRQQNRKNGVLDHRLAAQRARQREAARDAVRRRVVGLLRAPRTFKPRHTWQTQHP